MPLSAGNRKPTVQAVGNVPNDKFIRLIYFSVNIYVKLICMRPRTVGYELCPTRFHQALRRYAFLMNEYII